MNTHIQLYTHSHENTMHKYILHYALLIVLTNTSLHALESANKAQLGQPLTLKELAANACVEKAAQDTSFFETLKQIASTIKGLIPFKPSILFTQTSITPGLPGIAEIIVSPAAGFVITRDMHNKAGVHTYDKEGSLKRISKPYSDEPYHPLARWDYSPVVLASSDLNTIVACISFGGQITIPRKVLYETPGCMQCLHLRLGTSSLVSPDLSFFSSENGTEVSIYNHSAATIHRVLFQGYDRILKLHYQLPKHDLYAISNDGTLFVGALHEDQKEKSKVSLFDIKKPFNPSLGSNTQKETEQPLASLTLSRMRSIAISPDNQEIAFLPLLQDLRQEDDAAYVKIHAISALLNNKKVYRKLLCPDRATPSCIAWVSDDKIALGSTAGHITLHQRETGHQLLTIQSQNLCVTALAHDPLKNILIAGYETAQESQIREAIDLDKAEQKLSHEQGAIIAMLHRARTNGIWAAHFDAATEKLPDYAQQLIANTTPPVIQRTLEAPKGAHIREEMFSNVQAQSNIDMSSNACRRSTSRVCCIQ